MIWKLFLCSVLLTVFARAQYPATSGAPTGGSGSSIKNALTYGAKPDGRTDNTAVLQHLLDMVKSAGVAGVYDRPVIYLPAGRYVVSKLTLDSCRGVRIMGDGEYATTILLKNPTDTLFTFSTPTQRPTSLWQGTARNILLEDLNIRCPSGDDIRKTGTRGGIAVMANGGGGIRLRNVLIRGFRYGFCAPFGGDFSSIEDAEFAENDVGVYLGPGTEQYRIVGVTFTVNQEDIVLEGATQGHIADCSFSDAKNCAICISADRSTRFGLDLDKPWIHEYSLTVSDCWFETGAGYDTHWEHPADIVTRGDLSGSLPRHIRVENCYLVSGVNGMAPKRPGTLYTFWDNQSGTYQIIRNLLIYGNRIDAVVNIPAGTYPHFVQENTSFVDGSKSPLWNKPSPNAIERSPFVK